MHCTTEGTRVQTLDNETYQKTKGDIRQKYTAANGTSSAQIVQEGSRSGRTRDERVDQTRKTPGVECVMTACGGCTVTVILLILESGSLRLHFPSLRPLDK
jgi:hypothetical protein